MWSLITRAHSRPALVATTLLNSRGGRLGELRLYHVSTLEPQQFLRVVVVGSWQLDYTPCCKTGFKNIALLRFLSHFFDSWIRRGIHVLESSKKLLYFAIWQIAFKYRFCADTGNRDHSVFKTSRLLYIFVLQFAAAITSCVKTSFLLKWLFQTLKYEMELWWLPLLADYVRRQNIEVN